VQQVRAGLQQVYVAGGLRMRQDPHALTDNHMGLCSSRILALFDCDILVLFATLSRTRIFWHQPPAKAPAAYMQCCCRSCHV
jgi:hypothetical protein